jgi:voltage-gated potassium channel Kch
MKIGRFVAITAVVVCSSLAHGQSVLSMLTSASTPVISIDPSSGNETTLMNTGATNVSFGTSAYDPLGRRLFFLTGVTPSQQLGVANLNSQTTVFKSLASPFGFAFFQWDALTGRVLTETGAGDIVAVDPISGNRAALMNTGASSVSINISAFDTVGRRLFFLSGPSGAQQLVIANLGDLTTTIRSIAIPASYVWFQWNAASQRILALTTQPGVPLISIDPATAAAQTIVSTNVGALFGESAFDFANQRLFFVSGMQGSQQLVTINLNNNSVSSAPLVTAANHLFLEFDGPVATIPVLDLKAILALALMLVGVALSALHR